MPRMSETQRNLDLIMDETLYERIEREAIERGLSKGAVAREILAKHFKVETTVKEWRVKRADKSPA